MEQPYIQKHVVIEHHSLYENGALRFTGASKSSTSEFFLELYRFLELNYLKFFKMDMLSKTLFLASEALLEGSGLSHSEANSHVAMAFYICHSSLDTDRQFQATIKSDAFFPSPSLFVYTLPNIALGEIAIRNHFMGENCTFIVPYFDIEHCISYVNALISKGYTHVLCGWFNFVDGVEEAKIYLISKEKTDIIFNIINLEKK